MFEKILVSTVFILTLAIVLLIYVRTKREKYPFKKKKYLMSIPERKFYEHLLSTVDSDDYVIFPQVPLSRVIEVSVKGKDFWKHFNKINKKVVDFVVFKKPNYEPILVIEYDDSTHERKDRKMRDEFLNKSLQAAGVPVIHVKYGERFSLSVSLLRGLLR